MAVIRMKASKKGTDERNKRVKSMAGKNRRKDSSNKETQKKSLSI
jgi:hypothetical protein